jgi:hypothetical protein
MQHVSRIFFVLVLMILPLLAAAQEVQFSSTTRLFMQRIERFKPLKPGSVNEINELNKEFMIVVSGKKVMAGAMLKVNEEIDMKRLKKLGVEINTNAGGILTARIPVNKLEKLKRVKGLVLVDVDLAVKTRQ